MSAFGKAWAFLKGDAFHPSVTGFRTAARRGFSQPPMMDEATFAEFDDHAERMDRPSPEQERYVPRNENETADRYYDYEERERNERNRINMEEAQRAMEAEERYKRMNSPDMRDALERLGF
jgi:hypothetical protein